VTAAAYYLVYPAPNRPRPRWEDYGRLLLDEGVRVLLRCTELDAERLAINGAHLVLIPLRPIAVAPDSGAGFPVFPSVDVPNPSIRAMIDQVSSATIHDYSSQLSGETPAIIGGQPYTIATRFMNSGAPIQKATQFIGEHLSALGYAVEYQQWSNGTNPNVIGERTGRGDPGAIFLIGGHLDDMPSTGGAPGADDNASGSVAALVMADIASRYQWGCTLRFAFWTGEEQGLKGSDAYATRARAEGENIRGYLNLDMISYNSGDPRELNLFAKSAVSGSEEIADLFVEVVDAYNLNLVPVKYVDDLLGDHSDNHSFWQQGYPAILAIEDYYGDFNPDYHTARDRLEQSDLDYYTEFVRAAVGTFAHMTGCLIPPEPTPTATVTTTYTPTPTATPTPAAPSTTTPTPTGTEQNWAHVGDLDGSRQSLSGGSWRTTVTVTVHDVNHSPLPGATFIGVWSGGYSGSAACLTQAGGQCSVSTGEMASKKPDVVLTVIDVIKTGHIYQDYANHDPEGDSSGSSITVSGPGSRYVPLVLMDGSGDPDDAR
jgi:hypothetical protein